MKIRKSSLLLFGEGGSGKTTATLSMLKLADKLPGLNLRFLSTDPNTYEGIESGIELFNLKLKEGQLYYKHCEQAPHLQLDTESVAKNFDENFVRKTNKEAMEVKTSNRVKYNLFGSILMGMAQYKGMDWVSQKEVNLGDYLTWNENTIFVVDGLTSIIDALSKVVRGNRIISVLSDYKDIQANLENLVISPLTKSARCGLILLAHPSLSPDPLVKQPPKYEDKIMKVYPKTAGIQLNGVLSSYFKETVFCYYDSGSDKYYWAGRKSGIGTSVRRIPKSDKLVPDLTKYPVFWNEG